MKNDIKLNVAKTMIERLRDKRDAPAVFKTKLASIRSHDSSTLVFIYEGPEDKIIYYHWLRQVAPLLPYEVLVCNGKGKVLAFRELLHRDKSDLKNGVYFFVDHDFDGLRGHAPGPDIHVTETYSVENYVVSEKVLDALLRVELHCEGEPAIRASVLAQFRTLYAQFLDVSRPLNQRIFVAKKVGIRNTKPWPNRINAIAKVALDQIKSSEEPLSLAILLEREPTEAEVEQVQAAFEALNSFSQYRGKFALAFLGRLLELFAEDRGCPAPQIFAGLVPKGANGRLGLDVIASKSFAPVSFQSFIMNVTASATNTPLHAIQ